MIDWNLHSNFDVDDEVQYTRILKNGTVRNNSERRMHTSQVNGNGGTVCGTYAMTLAIDDYIELQACFSTSDASSYWAGNLSCIRIVEV